jgi:hypothetical protein
MLALICLLASGLVVGLLRSAGEAQAATYLAERPGLRVELRTEGNRLVWVDMRYPKRCGGVIRRERNEGNFSPDRITFDRRTGRFFHRTDLRWDAGSWLYVLGGTRHPGLITGFLSMQSTRGVDCHSGRSWLWPRIRFVARLVSPGGR